uniref:28S ribosomal protein S35, mitochondrial n=1 Tax=Lygus hesperus TaxID=30085 RepID=A0A0A9Y553_LYGHE
MYSVGRAVCARNSPLVTESSIGRLFVIASRNASSDVPGYQQEVDEEGFRILRLHGRKSQAQVRKKREPPPVLPPRETRMPTNQKWSDVWPGPRTFHPASVPLPLRQGINDLGASPDKWANAELMKIPNFLHLTPPAIKNHCEVLKKFCTPWPEELATEEDMKKHFPLEVITSDYCFSAPTIRNPLSRIVTIKFPLNQLKFDRHSRDKFLRLVGERYDEETGIVTIVTDKCPVRKQNYDYALYLLTAIYHESWVKEPWENEKSVADYEFYDWDNSVSRTNVETFLKATNQDISAKMEDIEDYKKATVAVFDEGENDYNWQKYKEASEKLLLS